MNWTSRLKCSGVLAAIMAVTLLQACSLTADKGATNTTNRQVSSRIFHGAWFEVRYPTDFTPKPSLPSTTADGYDSAEFIAPDNSVSFYVFAPQWAGEATDIALHPDHERLAAEETQQNQGRILRWFTIEAANGSYRRSYRETVTLQGAVKTLVGIKYRNEAARRRYLEDYLLFQRSLELYAD